MTTPISPMTAPRRLPSTPPTDGHAIYRHASSATRLTTATLGALMGLAGIEHGVGEILQGNVAPDGVTILSWPGSDAFDILGGEPAMTVVPSLLVTGILAILASLAFLIWATLFVQRKHGGLVLIVLSIMMLLVGGGFGPPLIGIVLGVAATTIDSPLEWWRGHLPIGVRRFLARLWPWTLATDVVAFLVLLPGSVLLAHFFGANSQNTVLAVLVYSAIAAAFGFLLLTVITSFARDSLRQPDVQPTPSTSGQNGQRLTVNTLPVTRDLTLAFALSLVVAILMAVVSAAGLVLGTAGLYAADPAVAAGITASTAGIVVPGFLAQDALNLVVGPPLLLGSLWLARRGALIGLLLWPGALVYALYTYALYLVGAPFSALFLPYVALVAISVYTTIGLVASIDGEAVRRRLAGVVPARTVGGLLVGLALLTLAQDAGGAVVTALAGGAPLDPLARHVWTVDLTLEVPVMLAGGVLLWRRAALGYVAGAGLLLQFGLTPTGLAAILAFQPIVTGAPLDVATIVGLLSFSVACFAPLAFFVRGAAAGRPVASRPGRSVAAPSARSR